jgi:hypothetical protein
MVAGFDADLAADEYRLINRLRSVLLSVHPALERAIWGADAPPARSDPNYSQSSEDR